MALENKLGLTSSADLSWEEERISKKKALELFAQYPDVLPATEISKVIGYGTTSINDRCKKGHLKAFKRNNVNHIPKVYLIEFFCSNYFRTITRKSDWHIRVL